MGAMASQITSLAIFYSGADQRKHQSSTALAFVRGTHRGPVNSPHKCSVTRKKFPFDDVMMRKNAGWAWAAKTKAGGSIWSPLAARCGQPCMPGLLSLNLWTASRLTPWCFSNTFIKLAAEMCMTYAFVRTALIPLPLHCFLLLHVDELNLTVHVSFIRHRYVYIFWILISMHINQNCRSMICLTVWHFVLHEACVFIFSKQISYCSRCKTFAVISFIRW